MAMALPPPSGKHTRWTFMLTAWVPSLSHTWNTVTLWTVLTFFSKNLGAFPQISDLIAYLSIKLLSAKQLWEPYYSRRPSLSVLRLDSISKLFGSNIFWVTICPSLRAGLLEIVLPVSCFSGILFPLFREASAPWFLLELLMSSQQLS